MAHRLYNFSNATNVAHMRRAEIKTTFNSTTCVTINAKAESVVRKQRHSRLNTW